MSGPSSPPAESHMNLQDRPDIRERIPDLASLPVDNKDETGNKSNSQSKVLDIVQDSVMDRGNDTVKEGNIQNEETKTDLNNVPPETSSEQKSDDNSRPSDIPAGTENDNMDSSVETLTTVTPVDKSTTSVSEVSESRHSSEASIEIVKSEETSSSAELISINEPTATQSGEGVLASKESTPDKIKTHIKGDLVVVGTSTSSDRTTPSSTSENKGQC